MKWQAYHFPHLGKGWREVSNSLNTKSQFIWRLPWHSTGIGSVVKKGLRGEDPVRPSACGLVCSWSRLYQNTDNYIGVHCSGLHDMEVCQKGDWTGIKMMPSITGSLSFSDIQQECTWLRRREFNDAYELMDGNPGLVAAMDKKPCWWIKSRS